MSSAASDVRRAASHLPAAIQIKELQAQLLIPNGDTGVIGGVFATDESEGVNKVPFFGDIPVLGALFRQRVNSLVRNEMLVFVTPQIVSRARNQ